MKKILPLICLLAIVSCGQPITKEEKARLELEIKTLNDDAQTAANSYANVQSQLNLAVDDLNKIKKEIEFSETKMGFYNKGIKPRYILKLHFQEHKLELSIDRIEFDFEVPVDEEFYNQSEIGSELGSGSRSFKIGHGADVKVVGKYIL